MAQDMSDEVLTAEYEALYRYALSLCRNEDTARDIAQDTFLKAISSKEKYLGNSSLYTWLCAIAKNRWLDICRKNSKVQELEQDIPDDSTPLEQRLDDSYCAMEIHRILHTLDDPYKEVFSLRVFGQLSFKDISSLFGKTENWARVTFHRAKKQITEQLRKDGKL